MNRVILDMEASDCIGKRQVIEGWILQVDHGFALQTDQVMMAPVPHFVACGGSRVAHFPGHTDPNEGLQHTINSGPRDFRDLFPDFVE